MKYQIVQSRTGTGGWTPVFSPGGWSETWKTYQGLRKENPSMTYHIFPA